MEATFESPKSTLGHSCVKTLIADNLGKAGWGLGYISGVASSGEQSSLLTLTNRTETFVD
jgi:hypothetical protein